MSDRDAFEKLQRALRFEPSPDFEAKVRERIRHAPSPAASWLSWKLATWAAAAAVLALVSVSIWRGQVGTVEPIAVVSSAVTPPVVLKPSLISALPLNRSREMKRGFKTPIADAVAGTPTMPEVPEVIVSPDQAIALNGFLASLRERSSMRTTTVGAPVETDPVPEPEEAVDGTKPPKPAKPGPAPPLGPPISTIVIVPIKVELLTPVGAGGGTSKFAPNR